MNYFIIGQNIRRVRKINQFSQEELAEKINISVTHMSHIETGSTKLSLPVLVDIAAALNVSTDALLCENLHESASTSVAEINAVLAKCSVQETKIITETIKSLKLSMDKYL